MSESDALDWPVGPVLGSVGAYDTEAGYGTVRADDGREWWFHCTAIADGTRRIDIAAAVAFRVVAGHGGRAEAVDVIRR